MKSASYVFLWILVFCVLVPIVLALFLWSLNSLAAAGGASFYIPHTPMNYLAAFVFLAIIQGVKN